MGASEAGRSAARRSELADLLRARRRTVQPSDVGLHPSGRRNTPGLRREEVAQISGVSVTWYTWLEQGRPITVSTNVIDALARALHLDDDTHEHLRILAGAPPPQSTEATGHLTPPLQQLLRTVLPAPACVTDLRFDYIGWNETYARLWEPAKLPSNRRNVIWLALIDQTHRDTWVQREERSRILLAEFRATAAEHADDPRFAELIAALTHASAEFRQWWPLHEVKRSIAGPITVRHPITGIINLTVVDLHPIVTPALRLSVHLPLSPADETALSLLAQ
jgi:transcriptional regulator with XRE-family HTH domain